MDKLKATRVNAFEIFNEYGICIIEDYVNNEELKILLEEFNKILTDNKSNLDKSINNRCYRASMSDLTSYKMTNKVFKSDYINDLAKNLIGDFQYDGLFIHEDFQNEHTNNVYPHFDCDRKLKFYLCINDLGLDNGCFKALPNSREISQNKRQNSCRLNHFDPNGKFFNGTIIEKDKLTPIICKAGTMIIFDTNTIHCGGDNFKDNKYRQVMRLHLRKK